MTNPNPHGSSGPPPLSSYTSTQGVSPMFRRSSYASVLSGAAPSTAPQTFQQPTRGFSHFTSTTPAAGFPPLHSTADHSRHPSRSMEVDGHTTGSSGSWGRGGLQPSYSGQFGFMGNSFGSNGHDMSVPTFFVPSYLRGLRHAERLEEAHKARVAAQRDARSTHSSNGGSLSASSSSINLHKMVPSHRGMTHDIIERAPVFVDDSTAPLPSKWSDNDKCGGLDVQGDGLEVRFSGPSKTHDEAAAIRADHPMPRQCGMYYYEVTVVSKGKEGLIGIGFSDKTVPLNRLPGWEPRSWAYHGDDGMTFCCTASGKPYGPKYSTMDVIGCGINFRTGCAFFTKNGHFLGWAFRDIKNDNLYPSVGMKKPGEHLRVNFGQTPFVYDIDGMMREERLRIQAEISETSVKSLSPPLDETALIHQLIAQFLAHDGYVEAARAFAEEVRAELRALSNGKPSAGKDLEPEEDIDAINRQRIRSAILEGDIDRALKFTKLYYPSVLESNENIYFKLKCRKYIEMIRRSTGLDPPSSTTAKRSTQTSNGHHPATADDYDVFDQHMELEEDSSGIHHHTHDLSTNSNGNAPAPSEWERMDTTDDTSSPADAHTRANAMIQELFAYGKALKEEFSSDPRRETKRALQDTLALIAYEDPRDSPLAWMLETGQRAPVAEELNSAILVSLGKSSSAALERLCQQTEALVDVLSEDGGAGAFVNVRRDFLQ